MINVLHTLLIVFTVLVFQIFYDEYYLMGILCVIWAFMFWQFLLIFYAQIQFLSDSRKRSRRKSLANTLLQQAYKKNQFKASMKALRVWDYRLALWFLCGGFVLFLTYYNPEYDLGINNQSLELITEFFVPINEKNMQVNFMPGFAQDIMPLVPLLIIGLAFFTTILRVNQNRHEEFLYSLCGIIFLMQLAFIGINYQAEFMNGIVLRVLDLKDAFIFFLGLITFSELFRGAFVKRPPILRMIAILSVLLIMAFLFLQNINVPEFQALYFSGWLVLAILWGKKKGRSEKRQVMHQV